MITGFSCVKREVAFFKPTTRKDRSWFFLPGLSPWGDNLGSGYITGRLLDIVGRERTRTGGLSKSMYLQQKLVVRSKLLNHAKNRTSGHMLSNNGLCQCSMRSTCYYFSPISNLTELHALTLAAHSYALLCWRVDTKWKLIPSQTWAYNYDGPILYIGTLVI